MTGEARQAAMKSVREFLVRRPMLRRLARPVYLWTLHAANMVAGAVHLLPAALSIGAFWISRANRGISAEPIGRKIVMLAVANMRVDPRVEREARALAAAGHEVVVIWPDMQAAFAAPPTDIDWGPNVTFEVLPPRSGAFVFRFPGFLGPALLRAAVRHRPFAFHGHDLSTALVTLAAARRTGAHAVCDFHEWYSENVSWHPPTGTYRPHSPLVRAAYRWLERLALKEASAAITVSDTIARAMSAELSNAERTVHVVRNIPSRTVGQTRAYRPLRDELGIGSGPLLALWQGGVGPSRMIEPVIEALVQAPCCVFAIRGPGIDQWGPGYRALAERLGVADRLHLLPPVPSGDVVDAARSADVGVWTLPNLCRSFYFALPNKLFEYIAAGLPVLAADFPEAKALVEGNGVGLTFDPYDPGSIALAMRRLHEDRDLLAAMRSRTASVLAANSAEQEWRKLVTIYECLPRGAGTPASLALRLA